MMMMCYNVLMLYHLLVYIIIQSSIPAINIIELNITHCCSSPILPRLLTTPTILFDLLQSIRYDANKTSSTPSDIYISKYNEIRSLYPQQYLQMARIKVVILQMMSQPAQTVIQTRRTTKQPDSSTVYGTFDKIQVFERSSDHEKMFCHLETISCILIYTGH